jgi:hypothetical protein
MFQAISKDSRAVITATEISKKNLPSCKAHKWPERSVEPFKGWAISNNSLAAITAY